MTEITVTVNGETVRRDVRPRTHLADFLREDLDLTGVHIGCEHGVCGACTVIVDGQPERSCIAFAAAADGAAIRTIEDFDDDPVMAALRAAFEERHGLQCGYCTPGVLATAYDIVTRLPGADAARIREELSGNLCRCTGYAGMVQAIQDVAADPPAAPETASPASVEAGAAPAATQTATAAPPRLGADAAEIGFAETIDLPIDAVWRVLRDVDVVAACLPGASLDAYDPESGRAAGVFTVAIGPMRASFAGTADVAFDDAAKAGGLVGGGQDDRSRTSADGEVAFALEAVDAHSTRLDVTARYALRGPLAQFSRGAVVEAAARALMTDFARNVAKVAGGGAPTDAGPARGGRYAVAALIAWVRSIFR